MIVRCDNEAVVWTIRSSDIIDRYGRITRWMERLSRFNYRMERIATGDNNVPDLISRTAGSRRQVAATESRVMKNQVRQQIMDSYEHHRLLRAMADKGTAAGVMPKSMQDRWRIRDGLIWTRNAQIWRIVVGPGSVRQAIIAMHHDAAAAAHPGTKATLELVRRRFAWPKMSSDVAEYVAECHDCRTSKPMGRQQHLLEATPTPGRTSERVHVDFAVGLKASAGFTQQIMRWW